jgi:hypothetical protein
VLTDTIIYINAVVSILTLLEILLSEKQKVWVADQTVILWAWLDEMKKNSLLSWLRDLRKWIVGTAVFLAICYVVLVILTRDQSIKYDNSLLLFYISHFLLLLVGGWCGYKIVYLTLNARTLFRAFLRATVFACLVSLPFFGITAFMSHFKEALIPEETVTLFQMITVILFIVTTLYTGLMLIFWAVVAVPLVFVYAFSIILFVLEFIVRRIAEYPKGPILAASVLVGGIFIFVKAMT